MREDSIYPWEVRRPDLLLRELRERQPFDRPQALLARVDGPYEQQRLVDCTVLWDERDVWLGLRYDSNLCDVLQGDVLTVTGRGWVSHLDEVHGSAPRGAWATHQVRAAS